MFNINIKHKKYSFPLWQSCHQCKIFIIDTWSAHLEGMMDEEIIEKKEHRKHLSPFNPRVHPLVADSTFFAPSVEHIPDKRGRSKFKYLNLNWAYFGSPTLSSGLQMQSPDNLERKTESENVRCLVTSLTRTVVLVYDDIFVERVYKEDFWIENVSNKIQIDNLYSVPDIVWAFTVKEEFIEMEKSVDHTNNKWLTISTIDHWSKLLNSI